MADIMTFDDYIEAKLYAMKMRDQGYKARLRPRSNKWQVVLRVKGETGMPDSKGGSGGSGSSLSDAMGEGVMGSRGSYQEKLYRVPRPQAVTVAPEEETAMPERMPVASVGQEGYGVPRGVAAEPGASVSRIRGREPDISRLRSNQPDLSLLRKKPYLKDSPEQHQGGQ